MFLDSGRCCDLLVHPVNDVPFVPDDRLPSYLDLFRKSAVVDPSVDSGLAESSHLNDLRQSDEPWGGLRASASVLLHSLVVLTSSTPVRSEILQDFVALDLRQFFRFMLPFILMYFSLRNLREIPGDLVYAFAHHLW